MSGEVLFGLWGEADQPPKVVRYEPDLQKAVRTGQKLRRADLRDGSLADRRIYDDLQQFAETWLEGQAEAAEKLSALWIEGRSGGGKSAALLHVLAQPP